MLGVGIIELSLDGLTVPQDDPRLEQGWHALEKPVRWTDGAGWLKTGGARILRLRLHRGLRYWSTPVGALQIAA